jgi:hypothetical protein
MFLHKKRVNFCVADTLTYIEKVEHNLQIAILESSIRDLSCSDGASLLVKP